VVAKQGLWYVWDSRGGTRAHTECIQIVNFDLQKNLAAWSTNKKARITGSIESGRMTYEVDHIVVEFWREDKPNPTPYTRIENPDPIDKLDGDTRTWAR
jgi:hypothetical protein